MVSASEEDDNGNGGGGGGMTSSSDETAGDFYSEYECAEELGRGLSSVVRRCIHRDTGEEFAVKIMDVADQESQQDEVNLRDEDGLSLRDQLLREAHVLKHVNGHANIIRLHNIFVGGTVIFLVFELCPNGELFDFLTGIVSLPEPKARTVMTQLFGALKHCHELGVVHRDIKPENILLDADLNIKLTDFGFSKKVVPGRWLREVCGTPGYLSPEILQCGLDDPTASGDSFKGYRFEVDMWACGVVLYSMLGGNMPFWNRRQHKMVRLIISGTYHFDTHIWDQVSDEAKDLIRGLLNINSVRRLTVQQALEHPWFDKPSVSLGGIEALDSNDENDTEGEEPEEEEEVQRSSPAAAPPIQPIPEHSELPEEEEEVASSRNQSRASSRRSSHGDQYQYTPSSSRRGSQDRRYSMYNFGEQQVISVGGDHAEPKLLRTAHSFRVVALGIKSFMRVSGVKPSPVCMSEMARNPYSIRLLRKILDNDAVYIYKHWVKRGDGQNMAAFFDNKPRVEAARKKRREAEVKENRSAEVKCDDK